MNGLYILLLCLAALFWVWQFLSLMGLPDSVFVGRYDKLIWAAAVIFLFVLGAFVFFLWKFGKRAETLAGQDVNTLLQANETD